MSSRKIITGLATFLAIFLILPGMSQEKPEAEGKKVIKIKVVKEKDGTTTIFDTTITRSAQMTGDEVSEFVDSIKRDVQEFELELENMDYNYSFDGNLPVHPDCRMNMQEFDLEGFDMSLPPPPTRMIQHRRAAPGSLQDLLGNIPLERVKSYSVKDHKGGKRIVIDVENAPLYESRDMDIVIRHDGKPKRMKQRHGNPERDVRVIIRSNDGSEEIVPPPPPPPPKKDNKPEPSSGTKPKI